MSRHRNLWDGKEADMFYLDAIEQDQAKRRTIEQERMMLLELVDGVVEIIEIYQPGSPAQEKWKRDWLQKAWSILKGDRNGKK